jgi:hypothetical protein
MTLVMAEAPDWDFLRLRPWLDDARWTVFAYRKMSRAAGREPLVLKGVDGVEVLACQEKGMGI